MNKLQGIISLRKRIQTADPQAYRKRVLPTVQESLSAAEATYQSILSSESVSEDEGDTIASGRLYKALNANARTACIATASRLYVVLGVKSTPATAETSDPAEYYAIIDEDSGERRMVPTLARVLRWMKQRKIINSVNDVIYRGGQMKRGTPARVLARRIQATIARKIHERAYRPLHLTDQMVEVMGLRDEDSTLRRALRGLILDKR